MVEARFTVESWLGPMPARSPETDRFWDACNRNEFLIQRCGACGKFQYHYRALCAHCWADNPEDVVANGTGAVWTFSVVHENRSGAYASTLPYVVALVELDEGVRVFGTLVDTPIDQVEIGLPVQVAFAVAPDGQHIPVFRPARGNSKPR
jgi:uncharacterized OB-fold protein